MKRQARRLYVQARREAIAVPLTSMPKPRMRETMSSTLFHCPWPTCVSQLHLQRQLERETRHAPARSAPPGAALSSCEAQEPGAFL